MVDPTTSVKKTDPNSLQGQLINIRENEILAEFQETKDYEKVLLELDKIYKFEKEEGGLFLAKRILTQVISNPEEALNFIHAAEEIHRIQNSDQDIWKNSFVKLKVVKKIAGIALSLAYKDEILAEPKQTLGKILAIVNTRLSSYENSPAPDVIAITIGEWNKNKDISIEHLELIVAQTEKFLKEEFSQLASWQLRALKQSVTEIDKTLDRALGYTLLSQNN